MDSIKTLERLFKLEQNLSVLEDKFQERDKWCAALEFWLIKKFAYDFQSSSAEFEEAKEKERRRRNKEFYAEDEEQQEFSDEASRTDMNPSPVQYCGLTDKSSDGYGGNLVIDEPSTVLPPCSQIKVKSQNSGLLAQNNHLPTWSTHMEADDEMDGMEIVTNQENEVYSADSVVDTGQESQGHSSSRFPVPPKEEREEMEEQGEEMNELVGTLLDHSHFDSEGTSQSEQMVIIPDLSRTRNDEVSNLTRVGNRGQPLQASENLFLPGSEEVQKSPSTLLSNGSIIKIEAEAIESRPKLRCKRCKKLFDSISEVDHHMRTFHMPLSKKKKVEPAVLVQCQHCNKTLSSNYVNRHENKCSLRPTTSNASMPRVKGPSLVFSLPQEERHPDNVKTDSYIRPIVRPEGYACGPTTGILDKSCENNFNTNPTASLITGENISPNSTAMMNGNKFRENEKAPGEEHNMLRFSCKVCSITFSSLRECRLHIVTQHLQEVLKTPLPVPIQPDTNRIDNMELKGGGGSGMSTITANNSLNNLKKSVPTLAELLSGSKPMPVNQKPCRSGTGASMVQQQQKLNSQVIPDPGSSSVQQQQAFPSPGPEAAATGLTSAGSSQLKNVSSSLASAFQPVVKNSTSSLDHPSLLQSRLTETVSISGDNIDNIGNESHSSNLSLPYPCLHCKNQNLSNSFEYLQDLHMHVLRCHVKKVNYQCPLCSQEFSQQAFAEHIVKFHRQGTPMPDPFSNLTFGVGGGVSEPDVKLNPQTPSAAPDVSETSNSSSIHSTQESIFEDNFSNSALGREDQGGFHSTVFSGDVNEFRVQCGECSEFMSFKDAKSHASMHTYFGK